MTDSRRWPPIPVNYAFAQHEEARRRALDDLTVPWAGEIYRAVVLAPEDDAPRRAYAAWLREQSPKLVSRWRATNDPRLTELEALELVPSPYLPAATAAYLDAWIDAAEMVRRNPRADWRAHVRTAYESGLMSPTWSQLQPNIAGMRDAWTWRGFTEHVALQAAWFLEIADELYANAPIRHLSLTHCEDHFGRLLESPHIRRLRGLGLPSLRRVGLDNVVLNHWTDEHIERIANCPNLANLRYLQLDDASALTARAFIALARSPHLRELSFVRCNGHGYTDNRGWEQRGRLHVSLRAEVEAEVGYVPWLHAYEHYGWPDPMPEVTIEHPIALVPAIAARRGRPVEEVRDPSWHRDYSHAVEEGLDQPFTDDEAHDLPPRPIPPPDSLVFKPWSPGDNPYE